MTRQRWRPIAPHRASHAIETLVWSTRDDGGRDAAHAHQARISAFLNGPGRDTIARVFTRMSARDEVWQLDTLEIDTGQLSARGSFAEWAAILERELDAALSRARQATASGAGVGSAPSVSSAFGAANLGIAGAGAADGDGRLPDAVARGNAPRPSDHQRLEHFLFYLQHGYLPWSRSAIAGRRLSAWLAMLARRTGPRLWSLLRELRPASYVLVRLSQITPYQGLQALLAVRQRELAASLDALDAQLLVPLQARGRLGIHQVQQLQQAWRVAALRTLWDQRGAHLSIDGMQRLQRELGAALALQLGQGGFGAWRPSHGRPGGSRAAAGVDAGRASTLDLQLLLGVVEVVAPTRRRALAAQRDDQARRDAPAVRVAAGRHAQDAAPRARPPLEAALDRLARALDGSMPLDTRSLEQLLRELARREPDALRMQLRTLVLRHGEGTASWLARHGAAVVGQVLEALAADGTASPGARPGTRQRTPLGTHWAESLRQFALAALAQGAMPGGTRRGGLSALQAWLTAFSLRQLALGERPPASRQDWERLWRRAIMAWQHGGATGRGTRGVRVHAASPTPDADAAGSRTPAPATSPRDGLARKVRRRDWRWQVAMHWSTPRKVELLARIEMTQRRAETSSVASVPEAARRWQWVADAVATCIARLAAESKGESAGVADGERVSRAWRWHAAWLWEVAIRRIWRGAGSVNAVTLLQAWCEAAARAGNRLAPVSASPASVAQVVAVLRRLGQPPRPPRVVRPSLARAPALARGFAKRTDTSRTGAGWPCRWHAVHRIATRAERLAHILALPHQRAAVRDAGVRQQVRQWLADPALCADWLGATQPAQRWTLLGVLYPRQVATLRRCSDGLRRVEAALLPDRSAVAGNAAHWRFLADHVLVRGLPVTPDWLVRRHAVAIQPVTGAVTGAGGTRVASWFARVADIVATWGGRPAAGTPWRATPAPRSRPGIPAWFRAACRALRRAPDVTVTDAYAPLAAQPDRMPHPLPAVAGQADSATGDSPPERAAPDRPGPFDTHYVDAAGLVLLAVYCPRLFDQLGLLEDGRLRNAATASHAVRCLAWLVHGHDDASEPECVMQKLLCGMRLTAPLAEAGALDASTRTLLDGLLQAVIDHWKALGKTSLDGLRETFLRREGRLMREQGDAGSHWRLVVKPGPFDMLLDRLPWSFATIKFPWMDEVLYVDWR